MRKDAPIISCFHVNVEDPRRGKRVLNDISLEVARGAWVEIVGPSASGKSLLFSILSLRGRAARPSKLVIGGRNLDKADAADIAELRRHIGSCAETPQLLRDRTVIENLVVPFVVRHEPRMALSHAEGLLARLDLEYLRDIRVEECSRQERLCLGVMLAMIGEPELILLDSLLEQLEPRFAKPLMNELRACHLSGSSVVLFGREFSENARRGERYRLDEGELIQIEQPVIVELAGGAQ